MLRAIGAFGTDGGAAVDVVAKSLADSDAEAIEKAKARARSEMESLAQPEHVDWERREGVIVYIDRTTPKSRVSVVEDVPFDDDRIHPTVSR